MRLALILLAVPLIGAAPPTPASRSNADQPVPAFASRECRLLTETGDQGTARLRKLAELPPANAYAAMLRTDEKGCPVPVLYRQR